MDHSIQRLRKMKKYISWINANPPIEKQSNKGRNTPIHLESKGPSIKVTLIFLFLIMTFNLCFHPQFWVKWVCVHIGKIPGHIRQTHPQFPKCLSMFGSEWNAHQIDILDNLLDLIKPSIKRALSIFPPDVKKQYYIQKI